MHIDFLGPLTQTLNGNSYVGLAVCALTKYVEAAGKIANTKLTFLNIRIPLRFKPTTTPLGTDSVLIKFVKEFDICGVFELFLMKINLEFAQIRL